MDEIELSPLSTLPVQALSLRLARTPIRMTHSRSWVIDKLNPVHDLVICLTGSGHYVLGDEVHRLEPGDAMLIPGFTLFVGRHGGGTDLYTGIAQHFSLDLFGKGDVIARMRLRRRVRLHTWSALEPLVRHYRDAGPGATTTLAQHHQFMVLLLAYLEDAFVDWSDDEAASHSQDHLSMQIMFVAARLAADPLGSGVEEALRTVPFNPDYFRRAFRDRIGHTPQKYRELKRMEFALHRLGQGLTVKQVAAEMGYADPYFFSRMFKRFIGASPSSYRVRGGAAEPEG